MAELSVIIVNYNVKHFLYQCLHAVQRAMEGLDGEVIVVDNNSQDGSVEMLKENFPSVITILNRENTGFSRANNQGIDIAKGKFILLLNPDTLVEENTFRSCLAVMEQKPELGALGVKMIDGKGKFLPESKRGVPSPWVSFYKIFGLTHLFPKNKMFGQYHLSYLNKDENHEIEILSGAFMFMRKTALDKVGKLDESYFMYGEDIDLSYRFILGGFKNYYLSDTKILHYKGESTKKGSLNYVRVFYHAMIIFAQRYFGGPSQRLFILCIKLAVYFRASLAILRRLFQKLGFPIFEALVVYATIYGIKEYWEHYVKYIEGGSYPASFDWVAAPIYMCVFIGFLAFAGAYRKPYRLPPLILATFSGFIAIATVSYIFPSINFSRAIVGLSSIFTFLFTITSRGIRNFVQKGRFFFTEPRQKRVGIVAGENEVNRIKQLILSQMEESVELVGSILPVKSRKREDCLGTLEQMKSLVLLFDMEELIFCNKTLSSEKILTMMEDLAELGIDVKIVPPGADFIVGTQAIYRAQSANFKLAQPSVRRQKRAFDVLSSTILLIGFPLLFVFFKKPLAAFLALGKIFFGRMHMVGYVGKINKDLPALGPSIFSLKDRIGKADEEENGMDLMDRYYAKAYTWYLDLEILLKSWRKIS